jgi:ABC-type cobalamin/Fe3+-siderophores transport system ATPase subunit
VLKYLKKLTKLKISVIMSSHFPNHAMHYADKTALMKDGKLLFVGRPEEILTEKNLKEIYGVNIEVLNITRKPRRNLKVCVSVG